MKTPTGRQIIKFLLGPCMLIPQAFLVAWLVGGVLYEPPEIHRHLERLIFFQGSTDLGGGCLFAGTVALYVVFGFTAAWYLILKLEELQASTTFLRTLGRSFWVLMFHILGFIVGGTANWGYDTRVTPNDFRDMFLFAGLLYFLSVVFICALHRSRIGMSWKLTLAPLFTVLWLIIGSDGNTSRAGQLVQSGQDPQPIVRGVRQGIMLGWHGLCDGLLGDVGERASGALIAADWLGEAACLAILFLILLGVGRSLAKRAIVSQRTYWTVVCGCVAVMILVTTAIRYGTFRKGRNLVLPVLTQVTASISPQTIELIRNDPALGMKEIDLIKGNQLTAPVVAEIDRVFKAEYFTNDISIRLLIPLEDKQFLFLWQNPLFRYVDVRTLAGPHSQIIDYEEIRLMLEQRRDFTTPFFSHQKTGVLGMLLKRPDVLAGHVLLDQSDRVVGLVIVNKR